MCQIQASEITQVSRANRTWLRPHRGSRAMLTLGDQQSNPACGRPLQVDASVAPCSQRLRSSTPITEPIVFHMELLNEAPARASKTALASRERKRASGETKRATNRATGQEPQQVSGAAAKRDIYIYIYRERQHKIKQQARTEGVRVRERGRAHDLASCVLTAGCLHSVDAVDTLPGMHSIVRATQRNSSTNGRREINQETLAEETRNQHRQQRQERKERQQRQQRKPSTPRVAATD